VTAQTTVKPVPLTGGSLKQVQWAERIRSKVLRMVPPDLADELRQVRSAQFWITHRERTPQEWRGVRAAASAGLFTVECPRYRREDGLDWARRLDLAGCVMLDTETTGLGVDDEIVEIAIVRMGDRMVLLDTLVRPSVAPTDGPQWDFSRAPSFRDIAPQVAQYLTTYTPVAFNIRFDLPMIRESLRRCGLAVPPLVGECAMKAYQAFSERDRFPSLDLACEEMGVDRTCYGATHRALADALATIDLVLAMRAASGVTDDAGAVGLSEDEQGDLPF
jgi:DNA polymerase III epsilon subunit-like protein